MIDRNADDAKRKIEKLFLEQCAGGAQSKALPGGALACGQFIGEDAKDIQQRGLHGTAAALLVLSRSSEQGAADVVKHLVEFVALTVRGEAVLAEPTLERDAQSTIKQAELLYALSHVPAAIAATENVRREIATRLLAGKREPVGGWSFFLDESDGSIDPIPTAYAAIALGRQGYRSEARKACDYLIETLRKDTNSDPGIDSVTTLLMIYAVSETLGADLRPHMALVRDRFRRARAVLEPQLREQIEQNVEYWRGAESLYIRIPWQLYYACVELRLVTWNLWPSMKLRRLLKRTISDASVGGFKYPHSGRMLSSRSNAILHDVLSDCLARRQSALYDFTVWLDGLRDLFGRKPVRVAIALAAVACALLSTWQFFATAPQWRFRDFAPDLLATALIVALSFAKTR